MALKILTVDDSKTIRMIVKKAFKPFDCGLFEAENGVEGLTLAAKEKPDFVLFAGDMVYRGYREDQWQAWLEDIPGRLIIDGPVPRIIPLVPVIGNHDCGYDQNIADMSDYDYYREVFALPPVSGKKEHNELYYTLDFPALHLVVLWTAGGRRDGRSYGERVEREGVEQTGWLEQELERLSTTGDWVVTAQHFSIVSGRFRHGVADYHTRLCLQNQKSAYRSRLRPLHNTLAGRVLDSRRCPGRSGSFLHVIRILGELGHHIGVADPENIHQLLRRSTVHGLIDSTRCPGACCNTEVQ